MKSCTAGCARSQVATRKPTTMRAATSGIVQRRFTQRRPSRNRGKTAVALGATAAESSGLAAELTESPYRAAESCSARRVREDGGRTVALGIDIGGTGIKGALVDLSSGELTTDRIKKSTPGGGEPELVVD